LIHETHEKHKIKICGKKNCIHLRVKLASWLTVPAFRSFKNKEKES